MAVKVSSKPQISSIFIDVPLVLCFLLAISMTMSSVSEVSEGQLARQSFGFLAAFGSVLVAALAHKLLRSRQRAAWDAYRRLALPWAELFMIHMGYIYYYILVLI